MVYFGKCETKLKEKYKIPKDENLYILKVDAILNDSNIKRVEYEIFYPFNENNLTRLNLSFCENTKIDIRIPLNISKDEIDLYNSSSRLYNDICYTLTNQNGIDKPIKARRDDFINKNMARCEEGCEFSEYDFIDKTAICSCYTKIYFPLISEIKVDKKKLYSNFKNIKNIANFKMLKCTKLLLDKSNIFKNAANYLTVILLIISFIAISLLVCYNIVKIKNFINQLLKENKDDKKNGNNIIKKVKKFGIGKKKSFKNNLNNNLNQNINLNLNEGETKKISHKNRYNNNNKTNKRKNKSRIRFLNNQIEIKGLEPYKKSVNNKSRDKTNSHFNRKGTSNLNNINKGKKVVNYNDKEMNSLDYEEALKVDKRNYWQYYFSLLRTKHILIFSFCYTKDYNAQILKIYMFFYIFTINFVMVAMFYSDETMNKIYLDNGKYDFTYQLPKMFYTFIITSFLKTVLNHLGLYEENIILIKKSIKSKKEYKKKLFYLKLKLIFFFIINYITIAAFWFYLGCFCSVYKNIQIHLLLSASSSFAISLINPFVVYLFPGFFRIRALNKKSKKPYLYKLSKLLQIIL